MLWRKPIILYVSFSAPQKAKQSEKYRRHMPTHCKLQITATVNVCVAFLTIQSVKDTFEVLRIYN